MKTKLIKLYLLLLFAIGIFTNANAQLQSLCISGKVDGHEYVDLGLPSGLKWATENLSFHDGDKFDAAHRLAHCWSRDYQTGFYRHNWNEPSEEDFKELIQNCTWEWTTYKGKEGFKGTGPNGNYIFFPANFGGGNDSYGVYWSRTHSPRFGIDFYALYFCRNTKPYLMLEKGDCRFNVRPVF